MSASAEPPPRIGIVGAGWSGLAAAIALVERGYAVVVYEAAATPGGRARTVAIGGIDLDNGQHLLVGAYRDTLALMRRIGVEPGAVLDRRRLDLILHGHGRELRLALPPGPARVGLAAALLCARGLRMPDRLRALRAVARMRQRPDAELSVAAWLRACGQPPVLLDGLWAPLCLAALNVAPERASAAVFARVLDETFAAAGSADLLLPRVDLGRLFPLPARDWLERHGASLRFGTRVRALNHEAGGWQVATAAGTETVDQVVLATDPTAGARLLAQHPAAADATERLRALGAEPIVTVWLRYASSVRLDPPMTGRLDGPAQWLFDRALSGQPGLIAAVISGDGPHMALDRDTLARAVVAQLGDRLPGPPQVLGVVREKRATFACTPANARRRPGPRGPLPGMWLAGDCVDNGLPATLEGAVRNGLACARELDRQHRREHRT